MDLATLLKITADTGGSDLHLSAGSPPRIRVNGRLQSLDLPDLTCDLVASLVTSILTDTQQVKLEQSRELDIAFNGDAGRIRANLFHQKGGIGAAFRLLPKRIPSLEELRLPPIVAALAERPRGLVLVTGATGSGKSTTLAAMLDRINESRPLHILTIEDPIEYLHGHKTALVNQRELAADTHDLPSALRAALREDPDVVLVGEMRDLETMRAAMQLAETGHLTLATLHTNSAPQTITRIIDVFPAHQQAQIRTQLSLVLEGIVCQALLPAANATRRVAAVEVLIATPAIRSLIRDDKIHQIYGMMQAGQDKLGMQTMNQALARLVEERVISWEVALSVSPSRDELVSLVAGRLARRVS